MKYLGIIAALLIVYLVAAQMVSTGSSSKSSFSQAEAEAAAVDPSLTRQPANAAQPGATPPPPQSAGASLRRPLDRARELDGLVKQRNGAGEF